MASYLVHSAAGPAANSSASEPDVGEPQLSVVTKKISGHRQNLEMHVGAARRRVGVSYYKV